MNALLEKYNDLYFTENFLISLYETINKRKGRRIDGLIINKFDDYLQKY